MRVKRYIVDSMPDAMGKIRSELGADAVILSTKDMKVGGFLGMFQKKKIEVIAAADQTETARPKAPAVQTTPTLASQLLSQPPVARRAVPEAYRKSSQMMESSSPPAVSLLEREEELHRRSNDIGLTDPETKPGTTVQHGERQAQVLEEKLALFLESQAVKEPSQPLIPVTDYSAQVSNEDRLFQELQQMKVIISKIASQQEGFRELPEVLTSVQDHFVAQEMPSELTEQWIEDVYNQWLDSNKSLTEEAMMNLIRNKVTAFLEPHIGEGISEQTRIVYIAGPTGVGKTTTIAKLAADQIFRNRKKVGFITADTYRISAIEQLRTYASILNVPLEVVQSPGDMQRAMQRLDECDLILMDTAGRNYLNELFVAELHSLFITSQHSETYLVLSLTSKVQDMKRITEHFIKFGLDKVIFTKLDETESVGPLYNLLSEYPLKASYITNGQNVPDDLLTVDRSMLINLLMEEKST